MFFSKEHVKAFFHLYDGPNQPKSKFRQRRSDLKYVSLSVGVVNV